MKHIFFLIIVSVFFSCGNEKVLQLPEISHSEISEINDVSHAYLFYDETQKDSVELNRKNLIITTNWMINVDKRLTLKQAIPHIRYLQEKKTNSSHKNKNAKNYFTCHDTSRKNLGFIEFTDVIYHKELFDRYVSNNSNLDFSNKMKIDFNSIEEILIDFPLFSLSSLVSKKSSLIHDIKFVISNELNDVEIILSFSQHLTFQDYIMFKALFLHADLKNVSIANEEFIFN